MDGRVDAGDGRHSPVPSMSPRGLGMISDAKPDLDLETGKFFWSVNDILGRILTHSHLPGRAESPVAVGQLVETLHSL